jgi:predicted amidohydrolase YtcJ
VTDSTLFVGGRIFTGRRYAQALLVEGGRVVSAGPEAAARRDAAAGAERIDLDGALVLPGLADAHLHLGELTRARDGVDVSGATSVDGLARLLAEWGERHPDGAIAGSGLSPGLLAERRWPTVEELDRTVRDRPLILYDPSGHAAAVNTCTLDRLDRRGRPSRPGGTPPWVLVEEELADLRPIVSDTLRLTPKAMGSTLTALAALGLTSVGTMNTDLEELAVLRQLDAEGRLPLRVHAYPPIGRALDEARRSPGTPDGRFGVAGFKAFLDGAFGPHTASLSEAYADDPPNAGVDRGNDAELTSAIQAAREGGLSPALHAIGDRAVGRAVRLLSGGPAGAVPSRVEHASLTPPSLLDPLRALGAWLVVQPGFVLTDLWLTDRLGTARARWAYAFRTLADLGLPLAGSSDAPYDSPDPWRAMRAAVERRDRLGLAANPSPDQALSEPEALALYTTGAHRALGETVGGSLEPGAPADLVVLSAPRLSDALLRGASSVRATWTAGYRLERGSSGPEER